jgi:hypothetical protein
MNLDFSQDRWQATRETQRHTPELFEGARKSFDRPGDVSTGWSMAWKANFWARLNDGNRAAKLIISPRRYAKAIADYHPVLPESDHHHAHDHRHIS